MGAPQPGDPAPDATFADASGAAVTLSSMRGSWVLLHFTATWCPFCDAEIAHLGDVARAYAPRGVRTVVVDVEETPATWQAYATKHVAPDVLALSDATGSAAARFAPPHAQPSFEDRAQAVLDATLILDPQGTIRLFLLPDSAHFDPTFGGVRRELDRLVPEPVVAVSAASTGPAEVAVTLRIASGYHIMSDRPSEPTYIPTTIALAGGADVRFAEPRYPPASSTRLVDRDIATFEGTVVVVVPRETRAGASPDTAIRGTVRYQACTGTRCLFPTTRAFEVRAGRPVTTPASTSSTAGSPPPASSPPRP
jgi:peroxiredoxin